MTSKHDDLLNLGYDLYSHQGPRHYKGSENTLLSDKLQQKNLYPNPDKPEPKAITTEDTEESLRKIIRTNLPKKVVSLADPLCPLW